ncbi:hypothetical protein [Chitinophaga filiformis]|uniref:Carboxypeptidase regulatory-like domain-containing protein n=1 Tax=Chitinophaga filiformis TaxID=104663 RepID=A0ABY4I315_CHIFI|nr:hypothetical protein [Chitinophaga filiformis]UPK69136.1 hypothetical protein MYF79_29695 [Chitinophaga filiformis]
MNWIWISGVAFLLSFLAAGVLIFFGKELEDLGITGNIYYIILIPLGFSSAAFLAGAMKSYASFTSNESVSYGKLQLTGPIVIFALVVGGGFIMPNFNRKEQFDVKMRIVSNDRPMTTLNEGTVTLYIGKEPKTVNIHDGEVAFYNIPEKYHNRKVRIVPAINSYQLADSNEVLISKNEDYVDIHVTRTKESLSTLVRGSVLDQKNMAVVHALLDFSSGLATCYTDPNGNFSLTVPLPPGEKAQLKVVTDGITRFNEVVTISSTIPIDLRIDKTP